MEHFTELNNCKTLTYIHLKMLLNFWQRLPVKYILWLSLQIWKDTTSINFSGRAEDSPGLISGGRKGLTISLAPPPNTAAHMRLLRGWAASRKSSFPECVPSPWISRLRYTATTASHNMTFRRMWSSPWAHASRLIRDDTPKIEKTCTMRQLKRKN